MVEPSKFGNQKVDAVNAPDIEEEKKDDTVIQVAEQAVEVERADDPRFSS